jgi:O-methyltransferase involved in polyketide biosynthesis
MNTQPLLTGVPETMLIALHARAAESRRENHMIYDAKAMELVDKIDYDFSRFDGTRMTQTGVACRTVLLDRETIRFFSKYPDGVCISIGCGLDTRFYRLDNGSLHWYNLDLPEVIEIRKQFFTEEDRVQMVSKSALDPQWPPLIDTENKPVLIILEGILMYFTQEEVRELLAIIRKNFAGCTILMELMSPLAANNTKFHDTVKKTNAAFKWGVKNGAQVTTLCDDLILLDEWSLSVVARERAHGFGKALIAIAMPVISKINNRIALYRMGDSVTDTKSGK